MDIEPLVRVAAVGLVAWFWPHCARPCLLARGARPAARDLVLGITIIVMVVYALDAITRLTGHAVQIIYWLGVISGLAWILVVGAGYLTEYRTPIRATGGQLLRP